MIWAWDACQWSSSNGTSALSVPQFLVKHQVPKVWQTFVLYSTWLHIISSSFPQAKDTLKGNKFEDVEII
jgi:hypothetical protein